MLWSMSTQIFAMYYFCCLYHVVNYQINARQGNWMKVYIKLAAQHAQCKISVEDLNSLLDDFLFYCLKFCQKILWGTKIKPFSTVTFFFFFFFFIYLDFGLKFGKWHFKTLFISVSNSYFTHYINGDMGEWILLVPQYDHFGIKIMHGYRYIIHNSTNAWNNRFKLLSFCIPMVLLYKFLTVQLMVIKFNQMNNTAESNISL